MKNASMYLVWIESSLRSSICAFAETRTISWDPVTTYTDNTLIGAGETVSYSVYWTTDPVSYPFAPSALPLLRPPRRSIPESRG